MFTSVLNRHDAYGKIEYLSQTRWENIGIHIGDRRFCGFARPMENFRADVTIIARRTLDERDFRLFRMFFIEERDYKYTAPRVGLDRGNFFHAVYRIQEACGRAFVETKPYGLWPLQEYFRC